MDQPFLMPVEDVFGIKGRGTVVTGRIERGRSRSGEEVEIVGHGATRADGGDRAWRCSRRRWTQGEAGDNVGCLLRGHRARRTSSGGRCWRKPGSIKPHTKFAARGVRAVARKRAGGTRRSSPATGRSSTFARPT